MNITSSLDVPEKIFVIACSLALKGHPSAAAADVVPAPAPAPAPLITLLSKESLMVELRSKGLHSFHVAGILDVKVDNPEKNGFFKITTENRDTPGIKFKADTSIDRGIHFKKNILGIKGRDQPFPTGQACPLRRTLNSKDESNVPIKSNCETSAIGEQTKVMIKYNAFSLFNLENVHISIPIKSQEAPIDKTVIEVGSCWYDSRDTKEPSMVIDLSSHDDSNRNGSIEFLVPGAVIVSDFFPILVKFTARATL